LFAAIQKAFEGRSALIQSGGAGADRMKKPSKKVRRRLEQAAASGEVASLGEPLAKLPRWAVAIPILVPLAVYLYTTAPSLTLVDSGEFVLACRKLAIGHPPGVPTYVLLGHLFSMLPLSADIARRTNLFSSVCAALAAGFSYLLTRELLPELESRLALAGAMAFGFSTSLWGWAGVTEVYALNILLLTIVLWLAARGEWVLGCFTAGLALGVHHATVALALPPALYLAWDRRRPAAKVLLLAAGAGLLGLSVYFYLPWRAAQHPILNWGDPQTLERFWWHLTGKQYHEQIATVSQSGFWDRVLLFGELLVRQFTPVGFLLAAAGWVALYRRRRSVFWFSAGVVLLNAGFVTGTGLGATDTPGYYLPSFLTLVWCFALGLESLATWCGGIRQRWVQAGVLGMILLPAVVNFPCSNRHDDRVGRLYIENSLRGVPPGSLVLSRDWNLTSAWLGMRYGLGWDPHIVFLDTNFLRMSWFLPLFERDYPDLYHAASAEIALYSLLLERTEHGLPDPDRATDRAFIAMVEKLIHSKLEAGSSVFCTFKFDSMFMPPQTSPHGLLFEFSDGARDVELDLSGLRGGVEGDEAERRVRLLYAEMLAKRGAYLMNIGHGEEARIKVDLALQLDPTQSLAGKLRKMLPQ
jgi:hypothetical protein